MKKNNYFIFFVFIFFMPIFTHLRISIGGNIPIYINDTILLIALIFVLNVSLRSSFNKIAFQYLILPILILFFGFIGFLFSIAIGNPIMESIYAYMRMALPLSTFFWAFFLIIRDDHIILKLINYLYVACTIMTILGFGILFKWQPFLAFSEFIAPYDPAVTNALFLSHLEYYRLTWSMGAATSTGGLLAISSLIGIIQLDRANTSFRKLCLQLIIILINISGLIFTWTRHSWVAFVLLSFIMFIFFEKKYNENKSVRWKYILITSIAVIALMKPISIFFDNVTSPMTAMARSFEYRLGFNDSLVDSGGRIESGVKSLVAIADNPLRALIGESPGFALITRRVDSNTLRSQFYGHNFFSHFILNWGFVSLFIFSKYYFNIVRRLVYLARTRKFDSFEFNIFKITIGFLGIVAVVSFFDHYFASLPAMSSLLWFFMGIGSGLIAKHRYKALERHRAIEKFIPTNQSATFIL